ncbi:hypothetical protein [Motiliproteus sp. MSK22-1]|uniref:hypothetical protein n=1 Tax=Motiliproteus sp. MSK22-1 TaxID=1897630 RepID=UPI0009775186|nr:hypothetical protein [Motiliproteus sp. MSK22-1]OMH33663.1 hypothetical protein BGP75_11665 [Motiliproteus sp. MSK22-1]
MIRIFKNKRIGLLLLAVCSDVVMAEEKIATALPIAQALSESLLNKTTVEAVYLPPERLPVKRISSWLKNKSHERLQSAGPFVALVTVESLWPRYALYGKLRRQDIGVIPIDIARELNEPGTRVRISADPQLLDSYFWLAPDNLQVMSQILARDLSRIWPDQAEQIFLNLQQLQQQIQLFSLRLEQQLIDQNVTAICVMNLELTPLAEAMFLPLENAEHCPEEALRVGRLSPSPEFVTLRWSLDPAEKPLNQGIEAWLNGNFDRLQRALDPENLQTRID